MQRPHDAPTVEAAARAAAIGAAAMAGVGMMSAPALRQKATIGIDDGPAQAAGAARAARRSFAPPLQRGAAADRGRTAVGAYSIDTVPERG